MKPKFRTILQALLALFLSIFCGNSAFCANDGVEFDSYSWDFGQIMERDGIVSHTFVMTNTTTRSIRIASATPSCSCIFATFTRETIAPGDKGEVEVSFTPSGAVGKVFREVIVMDSENRNIATLEITADVIPSDRSIAERYPLTLSPFLYINRTSVPFGYIFHGKEKTQTLFLANASEKPMDILIEKHNEWLTLDYPSQLQANEEAELRLTCRTPSNNSLHAFVQDTLYVTVNGERSRTPIVTTMVATAEPVESALSPTLRTYPSSPILKKKGKGYTASLELSNNGTDELTIRNLQLPEHASCNLRNGNTLSPGAKHKVEIRSSKPEGFVVHLFCNDPQRPMKDIPVTLPAKNFK